MVKASGGGGADEDEDLVQIDNPARVLISKDHPSAPWQPLYIYIFVILACNRQFVFPFGPSFYLLFVVFVWT